LGILDDNSTLLAIIFGIKRLKMSKPYLNIFGSATMPSKELALECPMSRPGPILLLSLEPYALLAPLNSEGQQSVFNWGAVRSA